MHSQACSAAWVASYGGLNVCTSNRTAHWNVEGEIYFWTMKRMACILVWWWWWWWRRW